MKNVWWAVLLERAVIGPCVSSLLNVAIMGERRQYKRLPIESYRTDIARNFLAVQFLALSKEPDDTLIMLDNDHDHPADILFGLARHDLPVVVALAFRRGPPYDACFFVRDADGSAHSMADWVDGKAYNGDVAGHAAIAIQRRAFLTMEANGFNRPWWRYPYIDGAMDMPSEDFQFSDKLRQSGIPIVCDTSVITPHFTPGWVDDKTWRAYRADHPELIRPDTTATEGGNGTS
jgi:hypothetical protein